VYVVALCQQPLGKVPTVLSGDAGEECAEAGRQLAHTAPRFAMPVGPAAASG
jgi:hypothetical protein